MCFRYRPAALAHDEAALDRLNEAISAAISETGEAHMPTTKVHGRSVLRACFLHYENSADDVDHLLALIRRIGAAAWEIRPDPPDTA